MGEHIVDVFVQNCHDSRNIKTLQIFAIANKELHREGLLIREPNSSHHHHHHHHHNGHVLDFGDCYTGIATPKLLLVKNTTESTLHIELSSDRPKEISFELKLTSVNPNRARSTSRSISNLRMNMLLDDISSNQHVQYHYHHHPSSVSSHENMHAYVGSSDMNFKQHHRQHSYRASVSPPTSSSATNGGSGATAASHGTLPHHHHHHHGVVSPRANHKVLPSSSPPRSSSPLMEHHGSLAGIVNDSDDEPDENYLDGEFEGTMMLMGAMDDHPYMNSGGGDDGDSVGGGSEGLRSMNGLRKRTSSFEEHLMSEVEDADDDMEFDSSYSMLHQYHAQQTSNIAPLSSSPVSMSILRTSPSVTSPFRMHHHQSQQGGVSKSKSTSSMSSTRKNDHLKQMRMLSRLKDSDYHSGSGADRYARIVFDCFRTCV